MKKLSEKKQLYYQIICRTLIGTTIEIKQSKNPTHIGLTGTIVEERKNDIILQTSKGEKRIRKDLISFECSYKGKTLYMDGNLLSNTLQTRIKKIK